MRNSSQNAGCMRRSPASHCCQVRSATCTNVAASVCDSPAAPRAALTSSGVWLAEGPFGPLFGWLGISEPVILFQFPYCIVDAQTRLGGNALRFKFLANPAEPPAIPRLTAVCDLGRVHNPHCFSRGGNPFCMAGGINPASGAEVVSECGEFVHFLLQPLLPRGAVGKQCASHELNYTLIERKSKNFLREISEATVLPHNA